MLEREPDLAIVGEAGSIAGARSVLEETGSDIDLAVLDLGLPDGSGEELIPELREANPDAIALVLTSFTDRDRLARAVAAGAAGVLHKSATIQEVITAIRRLHAGEQLVSLAEIVEALRFVDRERQRDFEIQASFSALTERERDVLQSLASGLSDREISEQLCISAATVRTHVTKILAKLNAASRLQALVMAVRFDIVSID
jgi:DNA-binding NarL/FixJ family response regulator